MVRAAPLYVPPSIPKDFPGIAVYALQFVLLITAALFLLRSYTAVSARVRSPWFRAAGLAYLFSVVLVALTGVSISLVYLCLQAVAFLSISVDNQENQAQAAAR